MFATAAGVLTAGAGDDLDCGRSCGPPAPAILGREMAAMGHGRAFARVALPETYHIEVGLYDPRSGVAVPVEGNAIDGQRVVVGENKARMGASEIMTNILLYSSK